MSSFFPSLFWLLLFFGGGIYLAYQRINLRTSTIAACIAILGYTIYASAGGGWW